jgi:hypothetical protein
MLNAAGQTIYIINRLYSGIPTAANYMEQPTLSISSGAYKAIVTNPTERDMMDVGGHYVDQDRMFHIASGAVANQFDYVQLASTGDFFVVSEVCDWYMAGTQHLQRIKGRRIKVS